MSSRRSSSPPSLRVSLIAGAAMSVAVMLGGQAIPAMAGVQAPQTQPTGCGKGCETIDEFNNGGTKCQDLDPTRYTYYCLWVSPSMGGGHWLGPDSGNGDVPTITASFTDGDGKVRNNAASAANVLDCSMGIWVSPNYVGDVNRLDWGWGGNLTSSPPLRNNEASVNEECDG